MIEIINNFHRALIGQLIRVDDVDLLIALDDVKKAPDFIVKERRVFSENLSDYVMLTLDHVGTDYEYLLVCSIFKSACDVYLYEEPQFFTPDKRSLLMEGENSWLFDNQNYPSEIYSDDIVYTKKLQNELFDTVCIAEWETKSQILNYNLLAIETGIFHDGGGWVEFYEGRQINNKDVIF